MSGTLHSYRGQVEWNLADAVKGTTGFIGAGENAVALLYSPEKCHFALVDQGGLFRDARGEAVRCTTVFEARIFNDRAELRWLRGNGGKNRMVLLAEQELEAPAGCESEPIEVAGIRDLRYLLWGKRDGNGQDGWCSLTSARIGTLQVPITGLAQDVKHVRLKAREYLKEGEDGNVFVFEEVLRGLEAYHAGA